MIRWNFHFCVYTERTPEGFLRLAADPWGDVIGGSVPLESAHPYGFLSRPRDPDTDAAGNPLAAGSAGLLVLEHGGHDYAIPTQDPREAANLPELKKGESMQYGAAGQFIRCHADGAISLYTTDDGTPNGKGMYLRLSPEKGFDLSIPWGRLTFGPTGFHVVHSSGARIDMGAIGGVPAPLDAFASYVKIQGALVSVKGSAVSLGTDAGVANAAAVASLTALLSAIGAAIASLLPSTGVTGAQQSAVASALGAFGAAATNLGKVA